MRVKAQILTDAGVYPVVINDVIDQIGAYNAIMFGLEEQQLFDGVDEMAGKLIHISGGASIKHIVIGVLEDDEPEVAPVDPTDARQEGPVTFSAAVNFLGASWTITGMRYIYPKRAGQFGSVFLPRYIDGVPALRRADEKTLISMITGWRTRKGETPDDFIVLVPPGELSPQQAAEYCQDYVMLLRGETIHVAEEMTAKAYWGHARKSVTED